MLARLKILTTLIALLLAGQIAADGQSPDDRYPFIRDNKVGFIDSQGREVIPPRFGNAGDPAHFYNGLASVFEAEKGFGYIDRSGKFVIGPTMEWGWGRPFHDGVASVMIVGKNGDRNRPAWINEKGEIIFTGMGNEGSYFSNGLMPMPNNDRGYGFVDKNFKFVIQPQFQLAFEFSEGRAPVMLNDKWGFIDVSGKLVVPAKYDHVFRFEDGLARVRIDTAIGTVMTFEGPEIKYNRRHGFIDRDGNEVIALQFAEATRFAEGYALVAPLTLRRLGIIDKSGNFVHHPEFESAEEFHEGLALVTVKGKYGYIDTSGNWVIRPTFEHAESFRNGLARVSWKPGTYGYIDKTGKAVWRHVNQ